MKKLLGIVVLGLLWCNIVQAGDKWLGSCDYESKKHEKYNIRINEKKKNNRIY